MKDNAVLSRAAELSRESEYAVTCTDFLTPEERGDVLVDLMHSGSAGNCFFFGGFCTFFFFVFGKSLGNFLFHSETAGIYIRTLAFICPFLYTNTALESILNGLGRPDACLFHNIAGVCIRIGFVFFSIPVLGIRGYFYGMLLSQLILTLLHFIYLNRLEHV